MNEFEKAIRSMVEQAIRELVPNSYDLAQEIDTEAVAEDIDLLSLADNINLTDLCNEVSMEELAEHFDHEAIAEEIVDYIDYSKLAKALLFEILFTKDS